MKGYTKEDYCIIEQACKNAYSFGLGCISTSKTALRLNDIIPPKNLDSLVFKATEQIEKELNQLQEN